MSLTEKVAYLKGVVNGMNYDTNSSEGKIFGIIIDILDDMAQEVTCLDEDVDNLNSYLEEVDEDLSFLEDTVYQDSDCDCDCGFDCDCDCDCDCDNCDCEDDCDNCERSGAYDFFEVVCPNCNEKVYLDNSLDPSKVRCPSCYNEFSAIENN